ncbi:gamma-glutamyltransferase [Pseudanabaena sp. PCC 6802]|uniref:gamma-glutamyltransferase n=1 Tax=Pseudanabaena sp. PCC 6802 TaxID=118173 RepID=UPI00034D69E8|nr:gamma-glutamyltransferase [Pseudanabaena sp. PCC 6802]
MFRRRFLHFFLIFVLVLTAILPLGMGQAQVETETGSDRIERKAVHTQKYMVVAANPIAASVGSDILKRGGNAIDAAIAVQLVLGLVEPNASGIGGGGFLVYYDAKSKQIHTFDGRETAPATAQPNRFLHKNGKPLEFYDAVVGGKSVGVPGILRMLEMAHQSHGKLPWRQLFQPAIQLSQKGFPISLRLNALLSEDKYLRKQQAARNYFYKLDGTPKPVGKILVNLPYAEVLSQISKSGAVAFYEGEIAKDIVAATQTATVPGDLTLSDLATYQAKERSPVCGAYRIYKICGMGPPSSGGIAVLQMLGILNNFRLDRLKPQSVEAVHLFAEAGRLVYADRGLYIADSDFVPVPVDELINPTYLNNRAKLIDPNRAMMVVQPGQIPATPLSVWGYGNALEFPSTSHMAIIDRFGNAISMTSSIEDNFGSRLMVRGFLLNNQLTDFSFSPTTNDGKAIANRVEPRKRPRSSMAPTLVFDRQGKLVFVVGSAGGSRIINYVAKALVAVLDWKLDSQQAVSLPNFGNRNSATELEEGTDFTMLKPGLESLGHTIDVAKQTSGSHAILVSDRGLIGGVDPRRGGAAKGK